MLKRRGTAPSDGDHWETCQHASDLQQRLNGDRLVDITSKEIEVPRDTDSEKASQG